MDGKEIVYWIESHLNDNGVSTRTYKDKISILDANGIATYQLRVEHKDSDYFVHAISVSKPKPRKTTIFNSHADFMHIPRKKRLFTVELHDNTSISKIDEWLKEIQSKLK